MNFFYNLISLGIMLIVLAALGVAVVFLNHAIHNYSIPLPVVIILGAFCTGLLMAAIGFIAIILKTR